MIVAGLTVTLIPLPPRHDYIVDPWAWCCCSDCSASLVLTVAFYHLAPFITPYYLTYCCWCCWWWTVLVLIYLLICYYYWLVTPLLPQNPKTACIPHSTVFYSYYPAITPSTPLYPAFVNLTLARALAPNPIPSQDPPCWPHSTTTVWRWWPIWPPTQYCWDWDRTQWYLPTPLYTQEEEERCWWWLTVTLFPPPPTRVIIGGLDDGGAWVVVLLTPRLFIQWFICYSYRHVVYLFLLVVGWDVWTVTLVVLLVIEWPDPLLFPHPTHSGTQFCRHPRRPITFDPQLHYPVVPIVDLLGWRTHIRCIWPLVPATPIPTSPQLPNFRTVPVMMMVSMPATILLPVTYSWRTLLICNFAGGGWTLSSTFILPVLTHITPYYYYCYWWHCCSVMPVDCSRPQLTFPWLLPHYHCLLWLCYSPTLRDTFIAVYYLLKRPHIYRTNDLADWPNCCWFQTPVLLTPVSMTRTHYCWRLLIVYYSNCAGVRLDCCYWFERLAGVRVLFCSGPSWPFPHCPNANIHRRWLLFRTPGDLTPPFIWWYLLRLITLPVIVLPLDGDMAYPGWDICSGIYPDIWWRTRMFMPPRWSHCDFPVVCDPLLLTVLWPLLFPFMDRQAGIVYWDSHYHWLFFYC